MVRSKAVLEVKSVSRKFMINEKPIVVLDQVNLTINAGEMVAITGVSGSGKSTLLNILAGLDIPNEGSVWFKSNDLVTLSESKLALLRNRYMGFIFQQHHLIRELSVLENVMLPGMINGQLGEDKVTQEEIKGRAEKLISGVGLSARKEHLIGELSGGESQRTAIARALIHKPEIVFADEPTGNLDENNSLDTFNLLREMSSKDNTSIVMVSHSPFLASKCDKRYNISNKQLSLVP